MSTVLRLPDVVSRTPSGPMRGLRWPAWWVVTASVLLGLQLAFAALAQVRPAPGSGFAKALLVALLAYPLLWCALSPLVEWIDRRVRGSDRLTVKVLAIHLAIGLSLSVLHTACTWGLRRSFGVDIVGGPVRLFPDALIQWLPLNMVAYALIVGAWAVQRYRHEAIATSQLALRLEGELAVAQRHALSMQLAPHFLFNTMNTVAMLVRATRADDAVTMLAGFSDLLRPMLAADRDALVSLRDEIDLARKYLSIEGVRFGDRLQVRIDVPPSLADVRVPSLLLQPLLDNAVRHGIERRPHGGMIVITGRREDEKLELVVEDRGAPCTAHTRPGSGVGLATTRARLSARFGDAAELEFTTDDRSARVRMRLPLPAQTERVA